MSGLLNRMAKRALGPLDGVQPLLAPHYAPRPADPRAGSFAPETSLEIETPAAGRDVPRRETTGVHGSTPETGVTPARPHPASMRRAADSVHAASPALKPESIASRTEPARAIAPGPALRANAEENSPASARKQGTPYNNPAALSRRARESKLIQDSSDADSGDAAAFVNPPTHIAPLNETPSGRKPGEIEPLNLAVRDEPIPARSSLRMPSESKLPQPSPRAQAAPPAQAPAAPEQKTEIHITIGSIELRAPRPEPKAQRAPFRPRVTLDEFLHRRQEGRS